MSDDRNVTFLEDFVGAISTIISISAGIINLVSYDADSDASEWQTVYLTELLWSGIIEAGAITAVLFTDSDVLRAIGGFSMLGVNATNMYLINKANKASAEDRYVLTFAMHAIALGQAFDVFLGTFIVAGDGTFRPWFNPLNPGGFEY